MRDSAFYTKIKSAELQLNSGNAQTQGVALVLATQAVEQKVGVRVLLCSEGG